MLSSKAEWCGVRVRCGEGISQKIRALSVRREQKLASHTISVSAKQGFLLMQQSLQINTTSMA